EDIRKKPYEVRQHKPVKQLRQMEPARLARDLRSRVGRSLRTHADRAHVTLRFLLLRASSPLSPGPCVSDAGQRRQRVRPRSALQNYYHESKREQDCVGKPHPEPHRSLSQHRCVLAPKREQIVDDRDRETQDESKRASGSDVADSKADSEPRENNASGR